MRLVFDSALGVGVTIFTFLFCGVSYAYLHKKKSGLPKGMKPCLTLIALSGLSFCLTPNWNLKLFLLLFLMVCCLYGIAILCGTRVSKKLDGTLPVDLLNQGLLLPFSFFFSNFRVVAAHKTRKTGALLAILIGIIIAVPVLAIIVPQLTRADAAFEEAASQILSWCGEHLSRFIIWLPLSYLVGSYLFGLLYGNLHPDRSHIISVQDTKGLSSTFQKLSPYVFATTLGLVCAVYTLFLTVQAVELLPAILHGAPSRFSHAEYARQGFFELCGVSAFNLVLMAAAWLFTKTGEKRPCSQRVLFTILSVETLCLVAIAIGKMLLYINRYGLTQKRVYTLWLMGFLVLLFLTVLAAQVTRLPVVRTVLCLFCACFLLLCYLNVNTLIVEYNVSAYERGALETLDVESFYRMPAEAYPRAAKLYEALPDGNPVREGIAAFLPLAKEHLEGIRWHNQDLQSLLAARTPLPEGAGESAHVIIQRDSY